MSKRIRKKKPQHPPLYTPEAFHVRQHAQALQQGVEKFLYEKGQEYNSLGAVAERAGKVLHPSNPALRQYAGKGTSRLENYANAFGVQLRIPGL